MTDSPLPVYYLGDSHVRYFKKAARTGLLSPHKTSGIEVGGATAVGMRNPNAKTNAIGRFRAWIQDKPRESIVVFHLGEVDCGFVIWYRAAKHSEPIELQMRTSIEAYFEFIDELLSLGFRRIIITGATLPTITDDDQIGEVVVKRSSIDATQKERTALTIHYNNTLQIEATRRGLPYIDITPYILDPNTEVVENRMRNTNPADHHMNGNLAAVYWAERLRSAIAEFQSPARNNCTRSCTHPSFAKAYPGHSNSMPTDMRHPIAVGDVVSGDAVRLKGEYTILRNTKINGVAFPLLTMIHTKHFTFTE